MANDFEAQRALQSELDGGEKLLWAGKPDPRRQAMMTLPIVLFGIPFTLFALFWIGAALSIGVGAASHTGGPGIFSFFPLFGIPFILVGLGMLTSPFWAIRKGSSTVYGVTDRRILIVSPTLFSGRSVQTYGARDIGNIERTSRPDGSGDLVFARQLYTSTGDDGYRRTNTRRIGFFGIPDVREVERIVNTFAKPDSCPSTTHSVCSPECAPNRLL